MAEETKHDTSKAAAKTPGPDTTGMPRTTSTGDLNTRNPDVVRERMVPPTPAAGAVHEAVKKGGEVPLPEGFKRNPPGSIPRSPGEPPSGQFPPEFPQGPMPAQEADEAAAKQQEAADKSVAEEKKRKEAKK